MKPLTILSDDRVGLLADISYILGKSGINIDGLVVDVLGGKAVICVEVKDSQKAGETLSRNNFKVLPPETIVIKVPHDSEGEITEILDSDKVSLIEMKKLASDSSHGIFAITVDKPRKANKVLDQFVLLHM